MANGSDGLGPPPSISDPSIKRDQGLFQGQGGQQIQLEREGADLFAMQAATQSVIDPNELGNPIDDFVDSTPDFYTVLPSMDSIGPRPSTANAAYRAYKRGQRINCNNMGGYYGQGTCFLGQAAVDKATEASNNPDLEAVREKGQGWLDANSDDIDADGNFIGVLTESQITTANDINEARLEDLEAIADYTGEDIYTQKANELSTIITTIGNYGTTDGDGTDDGTTDEGPDLSELISEYGEDVVNDLKNKYEELKDFVGTIPEDPVGAIKKMAEIFMEGATGVPPECMGVPGGPAGPWHERCVTVGVLIDIGFPGLPAGMGGIFKGATIGEIKDGLGKIGKKFEDIVNGTPTCGDDTDGDGKSDEECTPAQILEDLGGWVVGSVKDIFEDDETGTITVGSVLGTMGGIFGAVLGGVIYDKFKDKINDEIENVIGIPVIPFTNLDECERNEQTTVETFEGSGEFQCGPCKQEGFEPIGPNGKCIDPSSIEDPDFDSEQCSNRPYFEENKDACQAADYVDCDSSVDDNGLQLSGGIVKGGIQACEGQVVDPLCVSPEGTYDENLKACTCPEGYEYDVEDEIEGCGEKITTVEGDCPEGSEVTNPQYDFYDLQNTGTYTFGGQTYEYDPCNPSQPHTVVTGGDDGCTGGQKKFDGENCEDPCPTNSSIGISDPACGDDGDGGGDVYDPDCATDPRPTGPLTFELQEQQAIWDRKCGGTTPTTTCQDEFATNTGEAGPCQCPPGFEVTPDGKACLDVSTAGECTPRGEVIDYSCEGTTFVLKMSSGEKDASGECGVIYDRLPNYSGCIEIEDPPYTCDDPNATVREDGSCGPCKAGYVFNGSVERCVQESIPNLCDDSAYAAANPEECGTCNDCSCAEYAAANPEECLTEPPPEPPATGGGGGGGGGSGGGMFDMTPTPITASPELLAAAQFPIVNFLSKQLPADVKSNVLQGLLTGDGNIV